MPDEHENPTPKRFQFTLIWLFVITLVVAFITAVCFVFSEIEGTIVMLPVVFIAPSCGLVAAVYGTGYLRAFFLGSLVPQLGLV